MWLGTKLYNSLPGISCEKEFHPRDNYRWPGKWRLSRPPLIPPNGHERDADAGITNSWPTSTVHKTCRNNGAAANPPPPQRARVRVQRGKCPACGSVPPRLAATWQMSGRYSRVDRYRKGRKEVISIRRHPSWLTLLNVTPFSQSL